MNRCFASGEAVDWRCLRGVSGSPDSLTMTNVTMVDAMSTGIDISTLRITNTNIVC
jgi:hypothetical protein